MPSPLLSLLGALLLWTMLPQPSSSHVRLDGRIAEGEWAAAERHALSDGGEILAQWHDDDLYLALRGTAEGWVHVYLAHGNTVLVLHASAALGTATYQRRDGDVWDRVDAFEWTLRDTTFSAEVEAERATFFAEHGWVANTNGMGDGRVIELRIAGDRVTPDTPLAALFAAAASAPSYWPATLDDATRDPALVRGDPPAVLTFETASWSRSPQPKD